MGYPGIVPSYVMARIIFWRDFHVMCRTVTILTIKIEKILKSRTLYVVQMYHI